MAKVHLGHDCITCGVLQCGGKDNVDPAKHGYILLITFMREKLVCMLDSVRASGISSNSVTDSR